MFYTIVYIMNGIVKTEKIVIFRQNSRQKILSILLTLYIPVLLCSGEKNTKILY